METKNKRAWKEKDNPAIILYGNHSLWRIREQHGTSFQQK
jgi:hypothetical protein